MTCAAVGFGQDGQAEAPNVFTEAIDAAQRRCVKIYGAGTNVEAGYATGIVVSGEGHILTAQGIYLSAHRIRVTLPDGSIHDAKIVRRSKKLQTALLKVDAATPDYFALPEKPNVAKGDWVLAVSNLFKVADGTESLSVNLGVVSLRSEIDASHRTQDVPYEGDVLVVDAITSNPGASGGAVVDVQGNLVGMIGKLLISDSTKTRLNYAVPADLLRGFVAGESEDAPGDMKIADGNAELGIRLFRLGSTTRTRSKSGPAYIDRVVAGSPAASAGLKKDDLILAIDGEVVRNIRDYEDVLKKTSIGKKISIVVKRRNKIVSADVTPVAEK
jgi:serine protease Do